MPMRIVMWVLFFVVVSVHFDDILLDVRDGTDRGHIVPGGNK
jgi:hypothetical protein